MFYFHMLVLSDTKLLLTKNYSEITIFRKITNLTRNSLKMSLFLDISRARNPSKITKNNSQGIIFRNNFVSEGVGFYPQKNGRFVSRFAKTG